MMSGDPNLYLLFQFTPLREGRPGNTAYIFPSMLISIHAPT